MEGFKKGNKDKWSIFYCHVWLPEGKVKKNQKNDHCLAEFLMNKPRTRQHACCLWHSHCCSGSVVVASTCKFCHMSQFHWYIRLLCVTITPSTSHNFWMISPIAMGQCQKPSPAITTNRWFLRDHSQSWVVYDQQLLITICWYLNYPLVIQHKYWKWPSRNCVFSH